MNTILILHIRLAGFEVPRKIKRGKDGDRRLVVIVSKRYKVYERIRWYILIVSSRHWNRSDFVP